MVMEARRTTRETPAFKKLPTSGTPVPWTRIDVDRYEVAADGRTAGYVDVVGPVFVALAGPRYDRAVEICQTLTFHEAVDALTSVRR